MKKMLVFIGVGVGVAAAVYFGVAKENNPSKIDINGVWEDSSSSDFQNSVLIFSEQDGKVVVTHYLEWKGNKFVENGIGQRIGDSISYVTKVTLPIKGWASVGAHQLILSEDGKTLRGFYKDNLKKSGPIVFKKRR